MTAIWLSPGLPAPASSVLAGLGPDLELASGPLPPAGVVVAVATVYERALLDQLAARPGAGRLVLLKPPVERATYVLWYGPPALLVTPPCEGERLIQPNPADQT